MHQWLYNGRPYLPFHIPIFFRLPISAGVSSLKTFCYAPPAGTTWDVGPVVSLEGPPVTCSIIAFIQPSCHCTICKEEVPCACSVEFAEGCELLHCAM